MIAATILMLTLGIAPNAEPIKIAVPPLKLIGLDEKLADFYTGHLAQQLSFQGVRTITSAEIAALLGLDRQRALLGCHDDHCTANITDALGVDGVLTGSVTRLDKSFQLDVKVLKTGDGTPLASASASSDDNDRLVGTFVVIAQQLAKQLASKLQRELKTDASVELVQGPSTVKRLSWAPLAVGGAAAITGGIFLVMAKGNYSQVTTRRDAPLTQDEVNRIADTGRTQQTIGWAAVGVGVAGVTAAALMFLLGGNETVRAGVALTPTGAGLTLAGALP
jgi:hypothetical protein